MSHQVYMVTTILVGWVTLSSDGSTLAVGGQKDYSDDKDMKLYYLSCTNSSISTSKKTTTISTATLAITVIILVLVIAVTISKYLMYRNIVKEKTSYMSTPTEENAEVSQQEAHTHTFEDGQERDIASDVKL